MSDQTMLYLLAWFSIFTYGVFALGVGIGYGLGRKRHAESRKLQDRGTLQ